MNWISSELDQIVASCLFSAALEVWLGLLKLAMIGEKENLLSIISDMNIVGGEEEKGTGKYL